MQTVAAFDRAKARPIVMLGIRDAVVGPPQATLAVHMLQRSLAGRLARWRS
jgi:hypothetical protein